MCKDKQKKGAGHGKEGINSAMNIRIIIILTRGVGEQLTYGIPACYRVVLVERLGGLLFDGRRF